MIEPHYTQTAHLKQHGDGIRRAPDQVIAVALHRETIVSHEPGAAVDQPQR